MKIIRVILFILIFISFPKLYAQEFEKDYHTSYIGVSTSISSFVGGDFGSTYQLSFFPHYYDDDYYNNYFYNNYIYDDYDRDENHYEGISPLEVSLFAGHYFNYHLSLELESSFIWHPVGKPFRDFAYGSRAGEDYVEFNDNSTFTAVPIIASIKYFPFNRYIHPYYLSAGIGVQYSSESMARVRSFSNYDFNSYKEVINSYSSKHWYPGFKVALGYIANLNDYLYANFELKYQSFFNFDSRPSPLVMIRSSNLGYLALSTKVFFSF